MIHGMRKLVVVAILVCSVFSVTSELGAATDGLAYTEDTTFTILDDSVLVETTAVMSNTTTERRSGNTIYYSYFDEFQHVLPAGATDVSVTSRGGTLRWSSESLDDDFDLLSATLPSRLRSGQSRSIELSYVLPRGTIRGEGMFFSNPAFHSFPVWSFSDPGTGSLRVRVPKDAELGQFGGVLRRVGADDQFDFWEPRHFDVPEELFSFVTVTVEDALIETAFDVAGQEIVLRTWPDDDVWRTFARDTIEKGLPALETVIGLPVPDQDSLEVTESVTPYFYGYGGWYDPAETTIEVGNELDDALMLHELSHAWFNDALFTERWVNEGLAEEFTWRAQRDLGWPTEPTPEPPRTADPGAVALIDWNDALVLTLGDDDLRATEEYGYAASWYTIRAIVETIDLDGMQEVLAAVDRDLVSYVGDDPYETTDAADDWRRLLDLVAEAAGPDGEVAIDQLFADFVVGDEHLDLLDERQLARRSYRDLVAQSPSWRVPDELRHSLTDWDFDAATQLIDRAERVLAAQRQVADEIELRNLVGSAAVRDAYEAGPAGFGQATALLDEQLTAMQEIDRLRQTFAQPLSTNQRWGIGDTDLSPLLTHADGAFAVDRFEEIQAARSDMLAVLEEAEAVGAERILWTKIGAGASGGLALVLVAVGVRRLRRRRIGTFDPDLSRTDVVLSV